VDPEARLASAGVWLEHCRAGIESPAAPNPSPICDAREFLLFVPLNVMPPRAAANEGTSVPELCQAASRCADRARHAAWTAGNLRRYDPAISATSWHQIAIAATATSHHVSVLCTTLAGHAVAPPDRAGDGLLQAAERAENSRQAWLNLARAFKTITTDTRGHISPAAAEITDLAVWTGRLAYAHPDWVLANGPAQPARTAHDLAPRLSDVPSRLAAVHHTSEALACMAGSVLQQVTTADLADRILVPTRSLPEQTGVPRPFTVAPADRAEALFASIREAHATSSATADSLAEIAVATWAPSHALGRARLITRDQQESARSRTSRTRNPPTSPGASSRPGQIEEALREKGVTNTRHLWRAAALDQAVQQLADDVAAKRPATLRPSRGHEVRALEAGQ
jgi:hypothetical protein